MKKIALIEKITKDEIYATYNKNADGSHSKAFIKMREDFSFKINNSRNLFLKKGDSVEIFIEPRSAIALTFLMFIMPLIIFMVFYSVSGMIFQNDSEIFRIITGVIGIVFSFLSTYTFFKLRPQKLPEVIRKISSADLTASCSTGSGCGSCSSCG